MEKRDIKKKKKYASGVTGRPIYDLTGKHNMFLNLVYKYKAFSNLIYKKR